MRLRFQILLLLLVRMVINTGTRMIYPFLSVIARGLGVDLQAVSLALLVRASTGIFSPFLAALADRWGRKPGMLVGLALFVTSTLLVVIFPTFPAFFVSLSLAFLGLYLYLSSVQAYMGDRVVYEKRGLALALTETGWGLSFIIGMPVVGFLIARYQWQSPFSLLTGLGLLSILLLVALIPNSTHGHMAAEGGFWGGLRLVFTTPAALAGLLVSFAMVGANEAVNLVFGVWLESSQGLNLTALGGIAAIIGVSELIGEMGSGAIIDRLGKKRSVFTGFIINIGVALVLPWLAHNLWGAVAGLSLFYMSFEFTIVSSFTVMTEVLPAARATLMGANVAAISLGRMLGALIAAPLFTMSFQFNLLASMGLNLLAMVALTRLKMKQNKV